MGIWVYRLTYSYTQYPIQTRNFKHMKILVLFGHPAFQKSIVNKHLIEGLEAIPNVTFHDLYEAYPEMDIDIDAEQALLLEHDCIIFHHPFYWYSAPAIFKEWQDLVLEHGWAYGGQGKKLQGKCFFSVITAGAPRIAYGPDEFQGSTVRQFLLPYFRMAELCGMTALPPYVVHGTHIVTDQRCSMVTRQYHTILHKLGEGTIDFAELQKCEYFNDYVKVED